MKINLDERIPSLDMIMSYYDNGNNFNSVENEYVYACNSIDDFDNLKKWHYGKVIEFRHEPACFGVEKLDVPESKNFFKYAIKEKDVKIKNYKVIFSDDFIKNLSKASEEAENVLNSIAYGNKLSAKRDIIEKEYIETLKTFSKLSKYILDTKEQYE